MDAATKQWLDELSKAGSISVEDMNVLTRIAGDPKADEFIKGSALRQADYSRRMQEIKTLQDSLTAKEADVTKFQSDLAGWQTGAKESYKVAVQERERLAQELTAAKEKLRTVATLHNIDETEWNLPATKIEEKPVEKIYMTKEEVEAQIRSLSSESAIIDAAMHDLNVKHLELFGKPLPNGVAFVSEALAANKKLSSYFDEKFKVKERQAELDEAGVQKRIADAVAANDAKLRSEMNIASPRQGDRQSPLFETGFHPKQDGDGKTISAVAAATAAYNSGKYQIKQPGA